MKLYVRDIAQSTSFKLILICIAHPRQLMKPSFALGRPKNGGIVLNGSKRSDIVRHWLRFSHERSCQIVRRPMPRLAQPIVQLLRCLPLSTPHPLPHCRVARALNHRQHRHDRGHVNENAQLHAPLRIVRGRPAQSLAKIVSFGSQRHIHPFYAGFALRSAFKQLPPGRLNAMIIT